MQPACRLALRLVGVVVLGVGLVLVSLALLLMHGVKPDSSWTTLLAGLVIAGVGIGMCNPALATGAVGVVPPERSGVASGINNTCRQVGIATGIAALGAIFQASIQSKIETALTGTFEFHVRKDLGWKLPRAQTATHLITFGLDADLDDAARQALH